MDIKKTANLFANFTIKRIAEIFGITVFCAGVLLLLALITYSPEDPNFIFPENTKITNILGFQGSFVSDLFFQSFGLVAYLISFTLIMTGINILRTKDFFETGHTKISSNALSMTVIARKYTLRINFCYNNWTPLEIFVD